MRSVSPIPLHGRYSKFFDVRRLSAGRDSRDAAAVRGVLQQIVVAAFARAPPTPRRQQPSSAPPRSIAAEESPRRRPRNPTVPAPSTKHSKKSASGESYSRRVISLP